MYDGLLCRRVPWFWLIHSVDTQACFSLMNTVILQPALLLFRRSGGRGCDPIEASRTSSLRCRQSAARHTSLLQLALYRTSYISHLEDVRFNKRGFQVLLAVSCNQDMSHASAGHGQSTSGEFRWALSSEEKLFGAFA